MKAIDQYKNIVINFSYLTILQLCNLIIPLVTYPYLIKVLGEEIYGSVIFAQAVTSYLAIFVNFGFNISATKAVSSFRSDTNRLIEICSSVYLVKGLFFMLVCLLLGILFFLFPRIYSDFPLFALSMWLCLYEFLFPIWFFQGIEKMKYIAILSLISRLFFLFFVFLFITNPDDYLYVPAINGLGGIITSIFSICILKYKYGIKFRFQKYQKILYYTKDSMKLFMTSVTGIIKDRTNTIIIGMSLGMSDVTYYDFVDKIVNVLSTFFYAIGNVVFPNYNANRKVIFAKKILIYSSVLGVFLYALVGFLLDDFIILFFDQSLLKCVGVYWVLGGIFIFRHISYYLGTVFLITHNFIKEVIKNMFYSMLVYLMLVGACYLLGILNLYTLSMSLVISVLFEAINRLYYCKLRRIL